MMETGVDLPIVLFIVFAATLVGFLIARPEEAKSYEWLLAPFLIVLTVVFFRFRTHFVFLMAPTLAWHLSRVHGRKLIRWLPTALISLALLAHVVYKEAGAPFYRFGAGIHSGVVPQDGADFLQRASVSGTMFNTYGIGGYLIWRLWPEKKVFR
jgi:hypothetical protein